MFTSPGDIAIQLGPLNIYWYGISIATAFCFGLFSCYKIAENYYPESSLDRLSDLSFYILMGAIIGARLYFVGFNWDYFSLNLEEIPMLWHGGISIHGAIIGGFISGASYVKKHNLSLWLYADIIAFGLPIGQAIGRWGNFFNSEAFGKPTDLPWKLYIPQYHRPVGMEEFEYFHPTFLYESIWNIGVFLVLFFFIKNKFQNKNGVIFFSYLILYSLGRIIIEAIRIDSIYNPMGLPIAIWASFLMIIIGIIGLNLLNKKLPEKS